jgi:hypothetical protein
MQNKNNTKQWKINVDKRKYINMTISVMKTILSPLESTKEAHEQYSLV